ncbi:MAG: tetratricopeptide repeat protein [Verrucomicrobia bacterium]|nr:tetratricopeptide repeat protein [Verrucomicrobiota bacterium]
MEWIGKLKVDDKGGTMESNGVELARLMRERHRYEEAEAELLNHLAHYPNDPEALSELALTRMSQGGREKDALVAIEGAIGIMPDNAWMVAVRSIILSDMDRKEKAMSSAHSAIALDPNCELAWIAKGRAHGAQEEWKLAEESVREALKIDPNDSQANNLLALYLRLQGKTDESARYTESLLSRDAEDPLALSNAGWTHLHSGQYKKAEELFLAALRIEPDLEYARQGIREAYKARSFFYRLFLKWAFFMQRFKGNTQYLIIIGIFLAYQFGRSQLSKIHPGLATLLIIVYALFLFWVWLASGISHFILLVDKKARLTLKPLEKLDGILVGGFFILGVLLLIFGIVTPYRSAIILAVGFLSMTISNSLICLNESRVGRILFSAMSSISFLACLTGFGLSILGAESSFYPQSLSIPVLIAFATTWIANIPRLRS